MSDGAMSSIGLAIDGALAIFTLKNERKLNSLTTDMLAELWEHLDTVAKTSNVRALILTGEGSSAFCVGADIHAWGDLSPRDFASHWVADGHRLFDRLAQFPIPTIAAVNGHAMGGGLELAAACDIRVMAANARLALPEPAVGIVPGWSGTQRLARLLPEAVLKEMALFGVQLDANRAHALGFVADVCDDASGDSGAVLERAKTIATDMLALSADSIATNKRMINAAVGEGREAAIEALASAAMAASSDRTEGVAAFKEKRKPQFAS